MKIHSLVSLFALLFLATACASPAPATEPAWQSYSNPQAGFSIRYPSTWKLEELPDQNSGQLHGVSLSGDEGGIELYWGVGLGGACPEGFQSVQAAQEELPACYLKNADETEHWENINKALPTDSFSARAYTNDSAATSHDLVLKVISTLSFP